MEQLERIREMETKMDALKEAVTGLRDALEAFRKVQPQAVELSEYYTGELWMQDFEDDEAGKLPADLKRGVLSEDALYNVLSDRDELVLELLETATRILREDATAVEE